MTRLGVTPVTTRRPTRADLWAQVLELQMQNKALTDALRDIAIPSLAYCERKYGHDNAARLNCEAALTPKVSP
jgi:hypothetical protein